MHRHPSTDLLPLQPSDGRPAWVAPGRRAAGFAAVAAVAIGTGALAARAPLVAVGAFAAIGAALVLVQGSRLLWARLTLAVLPWMLVFDQQVPQMSRTIVTMIAAAALLALCWPLRFRSALGPVAAAVWVVIVLSHGVFAETFEQAKQAVSYTIFPAVALAVLSERGRTELPKVRNVVMASGLAAMAVHTAFALAGLGAAGTKYGVGEKLGFAAEAPHEMALLSVVIAAAALTLSEKVWIRAPLFALAALPALLTGVRSALLAMAVILIVLLWEQRASPRSIAVVSVACVLALVGGGGSVIEERLASTFREGATVEDTSSSRTAIWGVAFDLWADSGADGWVFGTGLRSIPEAQLRELGVEYIGHSDIVEIGVQIGALALIAWVALWAAVFMGGLRPMIFIPVLVYALVNGSIGYVAPLTLALVLAAACRDGRRGRRPTREMAGQAVS